MEEFEVILRSDPESGMSIEDEYFVSPLFHEIFLRKVKITEEFYERYKQVLYEYSLLQSELASRFEEGRVMNEKEIKVLEKRLEDTDSSYLLEIFKDFKEEK